MSHVWGRKPQSGWCTVTGIIIVICHLQVFSNMTSNIRRALFEVLMVLTFDNENSLVIDNGADVSTCACTSTCKCVHVPQVRWGNWIDNQLLLGGEGDCIFVLLCRLCLWYGAIEYCRILYMHKRAMLSLLCCSTAGWLAVALWL